MKWSDFTAFLEYSQGLEYLEEYAREFFVALECLKYSGWAIICDESVYALIKNTNPSWEWVRMFTNAIQHVLVCIPVTIIIHAISQISYLNTL